MIKRIFCLFGCLFVAACGAGVDVKRITPDSLPSDRVGIPYNLAFTQYDVTITRKLKGCVGMPEVLTEVEVKAAKAVDPARMYVLKSEGVFDSSDLKGGYDTDSVSTSLNATSEDRSPAVISNVISGVAQLVKMAASAGAAAVPPDADLCWDDAKAALSRLEGEQKAMNADKNDLEGKTTTVKTLTAKKDPTDADKKNLVAALAEQAAAEEKLSKSQKTLQDDIDKTTYVVSLRWPEDSNTTTGACLQSANAKCALPAQPCPKQEPTNQHCAHPLRALIKLDGLEKSVFDVYYELTPLSGARNPNSQQPAANGNQLHAIPVRFAAPGRLDICQKAACSQGGDSLAHSQDQILQFGLEYLLPAPTGALHSGTVAAEFSDVGAPKSLQLIRKSEAEAASSILKDTSTQAATIQQSLKDADAARLKAETDALKAKKDYNDALLNSSADALEIADKKQQTDLLDARAALAKALAAADLANKATDQ